MTNSSRFIGSPDHLTPVEDQPAIKRQAKGSAGTGQVDQGAFGDGVNTRPTVGNPSVTTPGADPATARRQQPSGAASVGSGPAESKSHLTADDSGWRPTGSSDQAQGGAAPWEVGQTGTMAGQASTLIVTDGGYFIEWPDVEAIGKQAKATIAGLYTTALAAYAQGNCESYITFKDYLIQVWGWEDELAQQMIDSTQKVHDAGDTMGIPPNVAGQPAEAAEGTQAAADKQDQKDAAKQKADAMAKNPMMGGGSGKMGAGGPPNKDDMKVAGKAQAQEKQAQQQGEKDETE